MNEVDAKQIVDEFLAKKHAPELAVIRNAVALIVDLQEREIHELRQDLMRVFRAENGG